MKQTLYEIPAFDADLPFIISSAGITHKDSTYKVCRKMSKITVIEHILEGTGTIKTPQRDYHPKAGDTYIIEQDHAQEYFSDKDDPWEKIWINTQGLLVPSLLRVYSIENKVVFHCDSSAYIYKIHDILRDNELSPKERLIKCSLCLHELVQFLSDNVDPNNTINHEAEMMKEYIDTNIYKKLNLDCLSKIIYKSPAQAIRIFKKNYGMTPYDYYMNQRIKTAVELLKHTNLSIKEIAFTLEYSDEHYFSNIFHKKTGKKPTDYRI